MVLPHKFLVKLFLRIVLVYNTFVKFQVNPIGMISINFQLYGKLCGIKKLFLKAKKNPFNKLDFSRIRNSLIHTLDFFSLSSKRILHSTLKMSQLVIHENPGRNWKKRTRTLNKTSTMNAYMYNINNLFKVTWRWSYTYQTDYYKIITREKVDPHTYQIDYLTRLLLGRKLLLSY